MLEQQVKNMLAEVLGLDDDVDEITPESNLIDDLAAESIDFIDIAFRLEKDFNLESVKTTDIVPPFLQDAGAYDETNKLKLEIIQKLDEYPHINGNLLEEIKESRDYRPLLKVKNIMNFVRWKKENG
jgi:acyl carrier protein